MAQQVPNGVIVAWVGTVGSIPAGWTRETALDGRYVKQVATSGTNPGATGGATTHVHPFHQHSSHLYQGHNHSGTWGTSTNHNNWYSSGFTTGGGPNAAGPQHSHTSASVAAADITVTANSAINTDTQPSDPLHVTVIFIKSDGSPFGIPVNGVVWFNSAVPTGYSAYGALDNRLMKGAATGADGGTSAGTDPTSHSHTVATHTHPVNTHTHTVSLNGDSGGFSWVGGGNISPSNTHAHALGTSTATGGITSDATAENTGAGDGTPPWQKMRAAQKTGAADLRMGIIAIWTGTIASIPALWQLCDGTNGTPNLSQNRFVRGAAADGEIGNTGGNTTHTHAAGTAHTHGSTTTHSHTFTGASNTATSTFLVNTSGAENPPTDVGHPSATYTSSTLAIGTSTSQATTQQANSDNSPLFTGVAYIMLMIIESSDLMSLHNIERGEKAFRGAGMGGFLEE